MTEKDVENYLRSKKKPKGVTRRELYETRNMRYTLAFLKRKQHEEISEELSRDLHFEIQRDIADEETDLGNYKPIYNHVGNSPTTPPQHVKERMKLLIEWYRQNKGALHPLVLASMFHMQFEMIHPFGDGNGRVGRLLLNQILIQNGYLPVTILERTKQNYYNALANRGIHQFMLYLLTTYIEEYKR
jgi:Fic family protein